MSTEDDKMRKWSIEYSPDKRDTMCRTTVEATTYTQAYVEFMRRHPSNCEITDIEEIKENGL